MIIGGLSMNMKKYIYALVTGLTAVFSGSTYTNPRTHIAFFDLDEVLIDFDSFSAIPTALSFFIANPQIMLDLAIKPELRTKLKEAGKANLSVDHLGSLARSYRPLQANFDPMMNIFHGQRRLVKSVIDVVISLKDQGYTIIVATNRDRIGFELTAKKLGFDTLYRGKRLFDHVIMGGNVDYTASTTARNGRRFSRLSYDRTYDSSITESGSYKPDANYYQVMRHVANAHAVQYSDKFDTDQPTIIFFDDKKMNVERALISGCGITAFQVPATNRAQSIRENLKLLQIEV
jgi:phosphoserine phosphatase